MDIVQATGQFERWLRRRIPVVEADLAYKHEQMRADPFLFFRATFYRWAQLWPKKCRRLAGSFPVRAVGDLHLENFGTWRDLEGRLIWGVNDFDEAYPMAFTNDLVRLAVSALLALRVAPEVKLTPATVLRQLQRGYAAAIAAGGEPFVLMERHHKLREMATQQLRQPAPFWTRLEDKTAKSAGSLPKNLRRLFRKSFPKDAAPSFHILDKPKGLGSLGRRRYLARTGWEGGMIAREAKDVVPSACLWAAGARAGKGNPWLEKTLRGAVRCHDPYYLVKARWLVRRLAPDCSRIDLTELKHHRDFAELLRCMGWETANVHLGTPGARKAVAAALRRLPEGWLKAGAETMYDACLADWQAFRRAKGRAGS